MATNQDIKPIPNGTKSSEKPIELAIALPHNPGLRIHIHLTVLATSLMVFLTSTDLGGGQAGAPMGSLVYAMPDV